MGVAYFGLNNTTGTMQGTTVNTTSIAGTWQTTDPLGTQSELFDTSSGNAAGSFGAQLNSVLVNISLKGATAYGPNSPNAPTGCSGFYTGVESDYCPNVFWLQNYIQYTVSSHTLTISNEIWNFSNPTADWAGTGTNTIEGFGSVEDSEVYQGPTTASIAATPPFTVELFMNYTQGPCHTDSVAGTGVPSCGSLSTTEPNNELFMNYTVLNSAGTRVCPSSEPTGRVCGEDDDVFFNSVNPSTPTVGVPEYGPHNRIGSATIQANGTAYDPVGLTNDFEFDYAIGSDDGATNNIVYQDGSVGLDYCKDYGSLGTTNALPSGTCAQYSAPPAATDFGSETGETSTGEGTYWAPQSVTTLCPGGGTCALTQGSSTPVAHLVTGPSNLVGLWNMTGSPCVGATPSCPYVGDEPLSYQNIAPANAWVGIARDVRPGVEVTNQSYFQIAPTFGFDSSWGGSGGVKAAHPTALGTNIYLPTGWYTIEVLLSGYTPVMEQIDLTAPAAPSIQLTPNWSTGAYTPDWAFSNTDLANLSVSPSNSVPNGAGTSGNPYIVSAPAPDVGAPYGVPGSIAWVFSNTNDYLFTQWIGAFVNSTTAVTQFNPAPSFPIIYPAWQQASFGPRFNVPSTDGLQYYLLNAQNIAVIGATDITAWGNSEATTIYAFVVNNGANILIADNTFQVSNRGIDFTGGGTADSRTINGVVVHGTLAPAINVVWGNTFVPDPQSQRYSGLEPFTAQDSLTIAEAYDRVYNNAFDAYGIPTGSAVPAGTLNTTVNAAAADLTMWNATCQGGYAPLSSSVYPPTTVCEPLSYSQTLDGYTMSGSILPGATFQGGNYWAGYGTLPDPYANIPYKARLTTLTGTAEIAATTAGFAGDYAPLIDPVYKVPFTESGLASSTTATAFEITVTNAAGYTVLNETATSAVPAGCTSVVCVNFDLPNGTYSWVALTSLTLTAPSPAVGSFTVSGGAVSAIPITWSTGAVLTFTESGLHTGVFWYVNITGQRQITSTTTTATITLANGLYNFAYSFRDNVGACYTGGSGSVTVSGTTGEPVAFTAGNYCVLFGESGITAGSTWQVTLGGVPKSVTTGSGTTYIGFLESSNVYSYSLGPVTGFSESALPSSGTVTVSGAAVTETTAAYSAFTVYPNLFTVPVDVGEATFLYTIYSGGTAPYTESWSGLPDGCSSATVASTGYCTPTDNLGTPYSPTLTFTDAFGNVATASVRLPVGPALSAGTVSASTNPVESGQPITVSTTGGSGGDGQYWYSWSGLPSGCNSTARSFSCTPLTAGTYDVVLNVTDGYGANVTSAFALVVDSTISTSVLATPSLTQVGATVALTATVSGGVAPVHWTLEASGSTANLSSGTFSPASPGTYTIYLNATDANGDTSDATAAVTVNPALVATLTANPTTTQVDEASQLSIALAYGVAPYAWTLQVNGSSAILDSGSGASSAYSFAPVGAGTYTFYLNSTDSVGSVSDVTATVIVNLALGGSLSATPNPTQVGTPSVVSVNLVNGVPPYSWTLQQGGVTVDSGTGASGSYSLPASAAGSYEFYLNASDSVGSPFSTTLTVVVNAALSGSLSATPNPTQVGTPSDVSIGLENGVAPYAWTLQVGGVTVDSGSAASATYSFSPASAGSYEIYLNASDSVGSTFSATTTVVVDTALLGTLSATPNPTQVGQPVLVSVDLSNGVAPYSWTLQEGGVTVDSGTGSSGSYSFPASAAGSYEFYLNASDSVGSPLNTTVTVVVNAALSGSLSATPNPTQVGTPSDVSIGLENGVAPYAWTLQVGGVTVDSGSAASATYSFSPASAGSYEIYLNATDSVGSTFGTTVTVVVDAALTGSLGATPNPTQVGQAVLVSVSLSNGVAPYAWTLKEGDVTVDSGTGASGSYSFPASAQGSFVFHLDATDAVGSTFGATVTVVVNAALSASLSATPNPTQVGKPVLVSVDLSNGVAPYSWTLQEGGVTIDSGTGASGSYSFPATAQGSYVFYLNATDSVGSVSDVTATVIVDAALVAHLSPATATIHLGGTVTYVLSHTGGVAPITYTLQASGPGLSGNVFTPTAPGTYTIYYNTTDSVGSVSDVTATVTVEAKALYSVTFTETGLPKNAKSWSVTFNGTTVTTKSIAHTATTATIEFNVTNGTYAYLIWGAAGYDTGFPDGSVVVAGSLQSVSVPFSRGSTPTVSFHEVGLATGSKWCVELASTLTTCSTTAKVSFLHLSSGQMYSYVIEEVGSASTLVKVGTSWVLQSSGTVTDPTGVTVQVRFAYLVTFTETGLPGGTSWSVTSEGQTASSTGTTIGLYLTNGTDGYTVHAVPGYKETSTPHHVVVAGGPASVSVTFTPKPGGAPVAGGPAVGATLSEVVRAIEVVLRL